MTRTLTFNIDKKNVLNSNTFKSLHWAVKGKITENLRTMAVNEGIRHHQIEHRGLVEERISALNLVLLQSVAKARRTKALQKMDCYSAKEIKAMVAEEFAEDTTIEVDFPAIPRLFNHFKVRVVVYPPTRRRLDPVNLYPTVKAIIDGLTDVAWWYDDDFSHLVELSFIYGGLSGEKDTFKIVMDVNEIDDNKIDAYVLKS